MVKTTATAISYHPAPEGIVPGQAFTAPTGSVMPSKDLFARPQRVSIVSGPEGDDRLGVAMVTTHTLDPIGRLAKTWVYQQNDNHLGAVDRREPEPGEVIVQKFLGFYNARLEGQWTAEDPNSGTIYFDPIAGDTEQPCGKFAWCAGHDVNDHPSDRASHVGTIMDETRGDVQVTVSAFLVEEDNAGVRSYEINSDMEWIVKPSRVRAEVDDQIELLRKAADLMESFDPLAPFATTLLTTTVSAEEVKHGK